MSEQPWSEASGAEKLFRVRHSTAHVMAQAVLEMFPDAKLAIGPPIANGFYYDFDLPRSLSTDDLEEIEKRMRRIVKLNVKFERSEMNRDEAISTDLVVDLTEEVVNKVGRTGGTFLHTSRTRPSHVPPTAVPIHLRESGFIF